MKLISVADRKGKTKVFDLDKVTSFEQLGDDETATIVRLGEGSWMVIALTPDELYDKLRVILTT